MSRMPSTKNSVWFEFAPRKKSELIAPLAPEEKCGALVASPKADANDVACRRARSAAEITATADPIVCGAVGVRVAVEKTGSSWETGALCATALAVKAIANIPTRRAGACRRAVALKKNRPAPAMGSVTARATSAHIVRKGK